MATYVVSYVVRKSLNIVLYDQVCMYLEMLLCMIALLYQITFQHTVVNQLFVNPNSYLCTCMHLIKLKPWPHSQLHLMQVMMTRHFSNASNINIVTQLCIYYILNIYTVRMYVYSQIQVYRMVVHSYSMNFEKQLAIVR